MNKTLWNFSLLASSHTAGHKAGNVQWSAAASRFLSHSLCCILSPSLRETISMLKWQGLCVLDSSWPQWETSHLHANLNHCSLTICRWSISNSCQSGGAAERLLCYMCTFACITESGFAFSYRMIHRRTPLYTQHRALYNPPEWLEFLAQYSHSATLAMRISRCFFLKLRPWTLPLVLKHTGLELISTKACGVCEGASLEDVSHLSACKKMSHIYLSFLLLNVSFLVLPLSLYNLLLSVCSLNQCCLCLSVSSFCFAADCLFVCFSAFSMSLCVLSVSGPSCQCPAIVYLRAAHLGSHHPYGSGQRCLFRSVPHQSDCSQLRQSPSVLLPLYWPNLTAGGQVRAAAGPEYSEYDNENKKPFKSTRSLATIPKPETNLQISPSHSGLSPSLSLHFTPVCLLSCFTFLHLPTSLILAKSPCFSLPPLPAVTNSSGSSLKNTQIAILADSEREHRLQ